jgi:hypothetical protein
LYLSAKRLRRHITGTARKPDEIKEHSDGKFYAVITPSPTTPPTTLVALSDTDIEAYETKMDEYLQKEALVRDVLYETVSKSTFLQIKNEPTAALVWKKLVSINESGPDGYTHQTAEYAVL